MNMINNFSAKANVSEAKVKPRSGGSSQKIIGQLTNDFSVQANVRSTLSVAAGTRTAFDRV